MERRCNPSAESVMSVTGKASRLSLLRGEIARLEELPPAGRAATRSGNILPFGVAEADRALGGGFPAAGLTEIRLAEAQGGGAAAGFLAGLAVLFGATPARPLLWIADRFTLREAGLFYAPGLTAFGLPPAAFAMVRPMRLEEALWAAEEAAASGAAALVVLEVFGNPARLRMEGTRRLHLRARTARLPIVLLRQAAQPETTAAPQRLRLASAPASRVPDLPHLARLIGHSVFEIVVEKSPLGQPAPFRLEWNIDERRFAASQPHPGLVASPPVDRPAAAGTVRPFLAPGISLARRRA